MRTRSIFLSVVVIALTLGTATPQYGQNATAPYSDADYARNSLAVNLLRVINTAEAAYRMKHGSYVTWDVLVTSEEFTNGGLKRAGRSEPQLASAHFSKGAEILPGWMMRLDLTNDGKGYDLLLEDATDKTCGYAAVTDERGLIRQSKVIDCSI
jgi:hypothetical protein